MKNKRLFIVSNRLPINITEENESVKVNPSSGGLISAISSYLNHSSHSFHEVYWAGMPGCSAATWHEASQHLPEGMYQFLPVMTYKDQYEKYYNGFSNSVLWPLFHYFPSYVEYDADNYNSYQLVNEHFADVLSRHLRPGDTIWIHDYHLLPLAQLIRNAMPSCTIGFFLHIPFPSFEIFRLLPKHWQDYILRGMLGADLVGFHTIDYASHFLHSVQMVLGLENDRHILRHNNRLVKVDVFPISIDYELFNSSYERDAVKSLRYSNLKKLEGNKIIFSVDRLDYTKGVHNRLRAYELFLKENPEYRGKVVFCLNIVPSRDTIPKYVDRKRMIDELVSEINGKMGNLQWQPIIYRFSHLQFDEMMALYTSCDLALITPLRDGMNLVAKEFVASRKDKKGVLIISEMAGAARELTDALTINPNDIAEMAQKIREGLEMLPDEQAYRLENMQRRIANYNILTWADDFMNELDSIKLKQDTFQIQFLEDQTRRELLSQFRHASSRLLLLDYDGTLVPIISDPEQAVPGQGLLDLLEGLGSSEENHVLLISGRSSTWLEKHFGYLPVNLIAEHGARSKSKKGGWVTEVQTHSEWKGQIHQIMEMYVRRCAHSFIEEKDFSIVWHYRESDPVQGKLRSAELISELNDYIRNRHLQVLSGKKIIEVRNSGIDKGTAIRKVLAREAYDFVFAVGDDRTDEDMFRLLMDHPNCYSIKIGSEASFAKFNLHTPQMVISLLESMNQLSPHAVMQGKI